MLSHSDAETNSVTLLVWTREQFCLESTSELEHWCVEERTELGRAFHVDAAADWRDRSPWQIKWNEVTAAGNNRLERETATEWKLFSLFLIGPNSTWLVSTRLDTFDFVERVETSDSSRAVPTWRTTNKLLLACASFVVCMLLHTQILFVPSNKIN